MHSLWIRPLLEARFPSITHPHPSPKWHRELYPYPSNMALAVLIVLNDPEEQKWMRSQRILQKTSNMLCEEQERELNRRSLYNCVLWWGAGWHYWQYIFSCLTVIPSPYPQHSLFIWSGQAQRRQIAALGVLFLFCFCFLECESQGHRIRMFRHIEKYMKMEDNSEEK